MTLFKGLNMCLICFIHRLRGVIGNLVGGGLFWGDLKKVRVVGKRLSV